MLPNLFCIHLNLKLDSGINFIHIESVPYFIPVFQSSAIMPSGNMLLLTTFSFQMLVYLRNVRF